MLIPLGILSSAGGGADFELISTVFGTGSSGSITFSSIPQTYSHLQIRVVSVLAANNNGALTLQMNGVSTLSYSGHRLYTGGSTVGATGNASVSYIQLAGESAGMTTQPTVAIVDVYDYTNTNKNKTIRGLATTMSALSAYEVSLNSGSFASTTAISSLTLATTAGNFATTTRISLYGIKG